MHEWPLVPLARQPYPFTEFCEAAPKPEPHVMPKEYLDHIRDPKVKGRYYHSNFNVVHSDDDFDSEDDFEEPHWIAEGDVTTVLRCPDISQEQKHFMIIWNAFFRRMFPPDTIFLEHWYKDLLLDFVMYLHKHEVLTPGTRKVLGIQLLLFLHDHRISTLDALLITRLADTLMGHATSIKVAERAAVPYIAVARERERLHDMAVEAANDEKRGKKKKPK